MRLKDQLLHYLQKDGGIVASGTLQRVEWPKWAYGEKRGLHTPRSVVRRLEELVEEGTLTVEYRSNHAYYRVADGAKKPKYSYEPIIVNGVQVGMRELKG